jgi:hypothetical protein
MMRRGALVLGLVLAATFAAAADDPLAGVTLEDTAGRLRSLDDLRGSPVLVVAADRRASDQANAWGERLATTCPTLAAWKAPGKVAWLSIVDGRGVPEYARGAARDRIREREDPSRADRMTMLIDWKGLVAERLGTETGRALLVLLSRDHVPFARAGGAPTDAGVEHLAGAVTSVSGR